MVGASKADKKAAMDAACWMFNVVTSVGVIMVNKALMATYSFTFATTLTGFHFATTTLMTATLKWLGYVQPSHLPLPELLKFVLVANLSIVGMNLSLMWNSVGFYQIAKLCMVPVSCLLEVLLDKIRYSRDTKLSILVVLIGVAVCTVTDVSVNAKGLLAASIAVWTTSLQQYPITLFGIVLLTLPGLDLRLMSRYLTGPSLVIEICKNVDPGLFSLLQVFAVVILQEFLYKPIEKVSIRNNLLKFSLFMVYVHSLQRKYSLGSFNLLEHTAPVQAATLLILGPFLDLWLTSKRVDKFDYNVTSTFFILLSCTIAVGTNLSQFICIGRFTAVSFQVIGHMKTILVLVLGFLFFGREGLDLHVVIGMVLAVVGMIWYGNASSKPGGKERRSYTTSSTSDRQKHGMLSESGEGDEKV